MREVTPEQEAVTVQQPVEVQVDEHEQIVERVVGIDVAKASGMVCLRVTRCTP